MNPSFRELLDEGRVLEVTQIGTICCLKGSEYCTRDRCQYWDKENNRCERFVWASVEFQGRYHTIILPTDKARQEEKIARFMR